MRRWTRACGIMSAGSILAGLMLIVGLLGPACDDDPTGPDHPDLPDGKDYVFYYRDQATGTLYGYHLVSERVDTFTVPYVARFGMFVSADGQRLYVAGPQATGVVALATRTLVAELPYAQYPVGNGIIFSPDGRFMAFLGSTLTILTYPDHEPVFRDTMGAGTGCFTPGGERLYYVPPGADQVRVVETTGGEARVHPRVFNPRLSKIRVLSDESRWVLYQSISCDIGGVVSVYDPIRDTMEFQEWFYLSCGMLAVSADDRWAFYDNPGPLLNPVPGTPLEFRVLNLVTKRLDRLVSTVGIADGLNPQDMAVGWLYVSPDSRWLVAAGTWGDQFLVFDVRHLKVDRYIKLDGFWSDMFAGQEGL
ncbi:MAG TPA: hypothetical protein PK186_09575 [candidate division Zixibacteria bacterium]|nr:hypothetical protein [candidate division Zixibacteria bacterium]MDD4916551.1 hypothetical protein [candidate division Zixibacteria bacterium]MDM7974249.1 hypothetical protein [candidate division Zixibacteria bacterium]HOD65738.1 hypothetical protein [candidate division Zixibacteria bacterium]HPM37791.1 hypothetical protein [candidate division Zixibacteria bacterium]